jgi:Restriction endonuclease S subunits
VTETVPLKRVASIAVSSVDKKSRTDELPVRLCNYTDVYYNDAVSAAMELMPATATIEQIRRFGLRDGDVVITKDSETADDIAIPAYVFGSSDDLVCGYHLAVIRPDNQKLDGRYLYWLIGGSAVRSQLASSATGVTRFGLRSDAIAALRIRVTLLSEQRAIAHYLDAETARIDAVISKKRRMVGLLRDRLVVYRAGVVAALGSSHGLIPLRRTVKCLDGKRVPLNRGQRAEMAGPYPYWGAGSIVDHVDSYLFDEELVLLGEDGAPFFDISRDVAFVVREPVWVNNHVHVLRPLPGWDADYLRDCLNAADYSAYITGSTRDKLTQDEMMAIHLPNAPYEAQKDARNRIAKHREWSERVTARLAGQINLLTEHRQSLITAAIAGELEIPAVAESKPA